MNSKMARKKSLLTAAVMIALILSAVIVAIWFLLSIRSSTSSDDGMMDEDLTRLEQEHYDSVFLSMHSTQEFSEEDFVTFRGVQTIIGTHKIRSLEELGEYFNCIIASDNEISEVYLALDPFLIWTSCRKRPEVWAEKFHQFLYSYMENYPEITYEILLPYPSLAHWLERNEKELGSILTAYQTFVNDVAVYANATVYFLGHEYWLIGNPTNYGDSPFDLNPLLSQKIFLYTFCDHQYQITPDNSDTLINTLITLVAQEKTAPTYYPDLSQYTLVFFGDSVLATASGSYSIPGYITGLSDATVYNYAIGGTSASTGPDGTANFPDIVDDFFAKYCITENGSYAFRPEEDSISQDNLYFVIGFGLNDYFNGAPLDNPDNAYDTASYAGGLRSSIATLREALPEAHFIILTPTFTSYFSNGTEKNSENGGQLTDYVETAVHISEELGIYCLDQYNGLGIDASNIYDFSSDGCHPNELGRLTLATSIMYYMDRITSE